MNDNNEQRESNEDKSQYLQGEDKSIKEQSNPPKDSEAISDAGKKRQDGGRYQ